MPPSEEGYVELALHAYHDNLTISNIEAVPFKSEGRVSLLSLEGKMNATLPPTLMVYLPILSDNETVLVQTGSFGKEISVEVVEGLIQPWEDTQWWEQHVIVARSPSLPTYGQVDPALVWKTKVKDEPGLYTIVVTSRDGSIQDGELNLRISIGGTVESD